MFQKIMKPNSRRESTVSEITVDSGEHSPGPSRSASVTLEEPPYAPGAEPDKPHRGFKKMLNIFDAKYARYYFKNTFSALRAPFRNAASIQDLNHILTLIAFLAVNLLPVHIFSFIVFSDYAILVEIMPLQVRLIWLHCLYYITWFFVLLYAVNVGRLLATLIIDVPQHFWWIDWEETLYRILRPRVIQRIKDAADSLWEDYHKRTWGYIRGIQAEVSEKNKAIHEVCKARNLPPLVEGLINDFVCLKGAQELDYRWYLHDNRANSKALEGLDYSCRETIASFLIPKQAFFLNKDEIVDLYCE